MPTYNKNLKNLGATLYWSDQKTIPNRKLSMAKYYLCLSVHANHYWTDFDNIFFHCKYSGKSWTIYFDKIYYCITLQMEPRASKYYIKSQSWGKTPLFKMQI